MSAPTHSNKTYISVSSSSTSLQGPACDMIWHRQITKEVILMATEQTGISKSNEIHHTATTTCQCQTPSLLCSQYSHQQPSVAEDDCCGLIKGLCLRLLCSIRIQNTSFIHYKWKNTVSDISITISLGVGSWMYRVSSTVGTLDYVVTDTNDRCCPVMFTNQAIFYSTSFYYSSVLNYCFI